MSTGSHHSLKITLGIDIPIDVQVFPFTHEQELVCRRFLKMGKTWSPFSLITTVSDFSHDHFHSQGTCSNTCEWPPLQLPPAKAGRYMSVQSPSQIRARGPGRDICYRPSSNFLPCPSSIHYLLWVLRLLFTWPWPVQPGVGHFSTFSCMAKTVREPGRTNNERRHDYNREQL